MSNCTVNLARTHWIDHFHCKYILGVCVQRLLEISIFFKLYFTFFSLNSKSCKYKNKIRRKSGIKCYGWPTLGMPTVVCGCYHLQITLESGVILQYLNLHSANPEVHNFCQESRTNHSQLFGAFLFMLQACKIVTLRTLYWGACSLKNTKKKC